MGRISQKQLAANRANARQSTGPRTEAGKIRSRGNAVRPGLTATQVLLPGETAEAFDTFRMDIIASLHPVGATEAFWAERIACLMWRLRRLPAFEAALFHLQDDTESRFPSLVTYTLPRPDTGSGGTVLETDGDDARDLRGPVVRSLLSTGLLDRLSRYDCSLQRQLRDALRTLGDLQAQRHVANRDVVDLEDTENDAGNPDGEGYPS